MSRAVAASEIRANSVPFLPRARRSTELTLLAGLLAPRRPPPLPRAPLRQQTPRPRPIHRYRSSSAVWLVLVASTRRLSTQRAGTRGFYFLQRHPAFTLHRATSHARAARTHLLVHRSLHNTTTLEHPPPPALLLLTAPPPPLDHRCLALLEHCTRHTLLHLPTRHPPIPIACYHTTLSLAITACPPASQDR